MYVLAIGQVRLIARPRNRRGEYEPKYYMPSARKSRE